MKKLVLFIGFTITLLATACSSNKLIEITHPSDHKTTIEGNFYSAPIYKHYSPAILFPETSKVWIMYGNVIKKDENGVLFVKKKSGLFGSSDTLYFKYDEIRAIVDSNKYCVWGNLNENEKGGLHINVTLNYLKNPEYSPIFLELTPDKNFAYSALPGKYEITKITLDYPSERKEIYYSSFSDRIASFEVKPDVANYIGDIKLLKDGDIETADLIVPYREQNKGNSSAAVGGLLGGAIGGAIVGAIVAVANENADSAGVFNFSIIHSQDYEAISNSILENMDIVPIK